MRLLDEARRRAQDWWVSPRAQAMRHLLQVGRSRTALRVGAALAAGRRRAQDWWVSPRAQTMRHLLQVGRNRTARLAGAALAGGRRRAQDWWVSPRVQAIRHLPQVTPNGIALLARAALAGSWRCAQDWWVSPRGQAVRHLLQVSPRRTALLAGAALASGRRRAHGWWVSRLQAASHLLQVSPRRTALLAAAVLAGGRRRAHGWWVSPRVQTIRHLPQATPNATALLARAVLAGGRRRAHDWWISPRVQAIRLLPQVSPGGTASLAAAVLAAGLLPVVAIVASGPLIAAVPGVISEGLASASGRQALAALCVIGVAFAGGQSAGRVSGTLATLLGTRLDIHLQQRVMVAVNRPAGIRHLDDPAIQDLVSRVEGVGASGYTPGGAVQGLSARSALWLQGIASAALLLPYRWWLAPLLVGVQLLRAHVTRRDLLRQTEVLTQQTRLVRRSGYFRDLALTPGAAKELQLFGLAGWVVERFRSEWMAAMTRVWRERGRGGWQVTAAFAAAAAANFAAYGLLGWDAAQGVIGLGALAVLLRGTHGVWNVASLGPQDSQIEYGVSAVPAVLELEAAVASEHEDRGWARPAGLPATGIAFQDVRFTYPGSSTPALGGVDLVIPAGRSLALVGANGAGKTTLVKLLCRLYDPDEGTISADGVDLRELDPRAWQRNVAAIFQDFTRFRLSVRDNIAFGALQRSDDLGALEAAARRADVLDRIRTLPRGWDTPLARHLTDGGELSGGEWQRVALARALLAAGAGARILVLDEPTANLDVRAEAAFYDRFLELTAGLTTILVSHRFPTVRRADLICVLEKGRVAELGTHGELVARGGSYAHMFALQAAQFADEPA